MPLIHEAASVTAGLAVGVTFIVMSSFLLCQSPSSNNRMLDSSKPSTVIFQREQHYFHGNFEPDIIKVIIGQNNTVRWLNNDSMMKAVEPLVIDYAKV